MFSYTFIALALCSFNVLVLTDTPFKDCGSALGVIKGFQVTNCDSAPCKFIKGNTYSMNLTFQANAPSKSGTVIIHGVIGGVPVPFPAPEPNACKCGMNCPAQNGDVDTVTSSLTVLSSYPAISLYAKFEVKADDQGEDYVCLLFPAVIVNS